MALIDRILILNYSNFIRTGVVDLQEFSDYYLAYVVVDLASLRPETPLVKSLKVCQESTVGRGYYGLTNDKYFTKDGKDQGRLRLG